MTILAWYLYVEIIVIVTVTHHCVNGFILPPQEDFINNNKMTWDEAENHCVSTYNSHLISIHDSFSFSQIRAEIHAIDEKSESFWIGLQNINPMSDGIPKYEWSDSTPFDFGNDINGEFPWFDERPEKPGIYTKVRLWGGGGEFLWDDQDKNNVYFWICNDDPYKEDLNTNHSHSSMPSSFVSSTDTTASPIATITTSQSKQYKTTSTSSTKSIATAEYDSNSEYYGDSTHSKKSITFFDMNIYWKIGIVSILCVSCFIVLCLFHLYQIKNLEVGVWKKKVHDKENNMKRRRVRGRSRESMTAISKSVVREESELVTPSAINLNDKQNDDNIIRPPNSTTTTTHKRQNNSKSKSNTGTKSSEQKSGNNHSSHNSSVFSPSSNSPSPSVNIKLPNVNNVRPETNINNNNNNDQNTHKRHKHKPILKFTASNHAGMLSPPPSLRHPITMNKTSDGTFTHHLYDDVEDQPESSMTETYHDGRFTVPMKRNKTPPPSKVHSAQNTYASLRPVISRYSRDHTVSYDERESATKSDISERFRSQTFIDGIPTGLSLKSEGIQDIETGAVQIERVQVLGAVRIDSPTLTTDVFFAGKATPKYLMDKISNATRTTLNTEDEEKISLTNTDDQMQFNGDLYQKFNKVIVASDGNRRRSRNKNNKSMRSQHKGHHKGHKHKTRKSKHIRKTKKHKLNEKTINELIFEVHAEEESNQFNDEYSETSLDGTIITMEETTDEDNDDTDTDTDYGDRHDESRLVSLMVHNGKSNNTSVMD